MNFFGFFQIVFEYILYYFIVVIYKLTKHLRVTLFEPVGPSDRKRLFLALGILFLRSILKRIFPIISFDYYIFSVQTYWLCGNQRLLVWRGKEKNICINNNINKKEKERFA